MQAPPEYLERFAHIPDKLRRSYAAMVSVLDDGVGAVLAALEQHQLRHRTLVCFLSDNGGPTAANGARNHPLRGFKGDVFEGGIRVPFLVAWPGVLPAGTVYEHPVSSLDLARTALAVGRAEPNDASQLDGVNLIPFLAGQRPEPPQASLFWRMEDGRSWAVRVGQHKLLQTSAKTPPALYDLGADVGEQNDLAAEQPDLVSALARQFADWDRRNHPPRFLGFREYHAEKNAFYERLNAAAPEATPGLR